MKIKSLQILKLLKENGYKSTPNRKKIITYISNKKGIFCVNDLIASLAKLDRVSIYRTVELLEQKDVIHPVAMLDGQQYYETHEAEKHHHHAICTRCHKTQCIDCNFNDKPVPGFKETHHVITITGLCNKCI